MTGREWEHITILRRILLPNFQFQELEQSQSLLHVKVSVFFLKKLAKGHIYIQLNRRLLLPPQFPQRELYTDQF